MSDQVEICPLSRGAITPILPITGRHSLSPPSPTRRPIGSPYSSLSQIERETYGLTTFRTSTTLRGLGSASLPRVQHLRQVRHKHLYLTLYLLVQAYQLLLEACQHLWLVLYHGIYQRFTWVTSRLFGCNKYLHDFVSHCIHLGEMIAQIVQNINSWPPGGWGKALPYGVRLAINRREQGQKGVSSEPDGVTRRASGYG